jgi:cobalt/nickel transport system ATP-binding protein
MDYWKQAMNLRFENIMYCYPGLESPVLNGVSLSLNPGERVALIGRNGGGKSTLMLIANGILKPNSGFLLIDGQPIHYNRHGLMVLRKQVGIVFQNPEDQLFSASVLQDISLGPLNLGLTESQTLDRVLEVAEFCGLSKLLDRPTHALSGGEKTRVALAGILAMEPQFLFADEITNSLDPWMRRQIMDILDQWVERGHTVVLSTHDWSLAGSWPQRVIWMDKGKILHEGTPAQVIPDPRIPTGEWSYA